MRIKADSERAREAACQFRIWSIDFGQLDTRPTRRTSDPLSRLRESRRRSGIPPDVNYYSFVGMRLVLDPEVSR